MGVIVLGAAISVVTHRLISKFLSKRKKRVESERKALLENSVVKDCIHKTKSNLMGQEKKTNSEP